VIFAVNLEMLGLWNSNDASAAATEQYNMKLSNKKIKSFLKYFLVCNENFFFFQIFNREKISKSFLRDKISFNNDSTLQQEFEEKDGFNNNVFHGNAVRKAQKLLNWKVLIAEATDIPTKSQIVQRRWKICGCHLQTCLTYDRKVCYHRPLLLNFIRKVFKKIDFWFFFNFLKKGFSWRHLAQTLLYAQWEETSQ
jgi:hypothetical protein